MTAKTSRLLLNENSPAATDRSSDVLSLQVSLPQMLDLALGTPEVGAVNLNILHNFLHVMLHQINLRATKVEYRGDEANRIKAVINSSKAGPSLQLHEYSITDSSERTTVRPPSSETDITADVYTISPDVEKAGKTGTEEKTAASAPATARGLNGQKDSEPERANGVPGGRRTKGSKQQIGVGVNGERRSVIFVEPVKDGVAPTALGFKRLEETIFNLQQRFEALDELANNSEMIERVKSNKTDPLSDMWHIININKRLDGCEKAIDKLSTMVQDLIKSDKIEINAGTEELGNFSERMVQLENQLVYLSSDLASIRKTEGIDDDIIGDTNSVRHEQILPSVMVREPSIQETETISVKSSLVRKVPSAMEAAAHESAVSVEDQTVLTNKNLKEARAVEDQTVLTNKNLKEARAVEDQTVLTNKNLKEARASSVPKIRHSIIGGVDLTELKNDVSALKDGMNDLQRNFQDLSSKISDGREEATVIMADSTIPGKVNVTNVLDKSASTTIDIQRSMTTTLTKEHSTAALAVRATDDNSADVTSLSSNKVALKPSVKLDDTQIADKDRSTNSSRGVHVKEVNDRTDNAMETPWKIKGTCAGALRDLGLRVVKLEEEISCINEKLSSEVVAALSLNGTGGIGDLATKIQAVQTDMKKMNEIASRLMDEKENRETRTNALIEQIELLKTIKADKEDLEDALADKADAQAVNRKVSHDQFDAACDDLARGLEDAIMKLTQQESIWQQGFDEVQREIDGKLDKYEISPLKEFVENRLKLLQEKLKALSELRREKEAAGTKKMLSDVQCISCDTNVVMRMEEGAHYRAPALTSTKSMKPYLTYELDQVRKQQRRLPNSRNMIQFEAAMQDMARKTKPLSDELMAKSPRDHLCNRYCGGSHTTTTPQQRVMRMGHFLAQWGPQAVQLTEGMVSGTDGQLYRSRAPMPVTPDLSEHYGDGKSAEIQPATVPSSVAAPPTGQSQRQSEISRGRSITKRLSSRRASEAIKETSGETGMEEIPVEPSTPPNARPSTTVGDADVVPEPPGPTDEIVRETSIVNNQIHEEHEDNGEDAPIELDA